jgi:hypothetical protein
MFDWSGFVTGMFGGAGASLGVVYGLSRWLGELWKSKIMEKVQQSNRAELEKIQQANREQLEKLQQQNRKEVEALKSDMQSSVDNANRLLDAGISKAILVTRTHFETEFGAYKEIFAALSDVKNDLHATRPVFNIAGEEERVKSRTQLVDRLNKVIAANNKAVVASENLRPFYQDEIFQAVQKCLAASKYEIMQVKYWKPRHVQRRVV